MQNSLEFGASPGRKLNVDFQLSDELNTIASNNILRVLRRLASAPDAHMIIDGREITIFGSNNYLGLANHPYLKEAAIDAISTWGVGSSGSRLTTGNLPLHEALEESIARFKNTEAAIVFGTGYAAGIGTITALVGDGDLIVSDALNHACLIDGCRLSKADTKIYKHNDLDSLNELLKNRNAYRRCLIVTDSVFSMDGDIAPLDKIQELALEHDCWLMIDDAHGTGVLGPTGKGTAEYYSLKPENLIQMGTLSKAVGSEGGFVAGSRVLISYLHNKARSFIFSTAPAVPSVAAAKAAFEVMEKEPERRQRLLYNAKQLRKQLGMPLTESAVTPIVPYIIGSNKNAMEMMDQLLGSGIYAPAIRPPTVPEGMARLRLSVTSEHTVDDIENLVKLVRFYESVIV